MRHSDILGLSPSIDKGANPNNSTQYKKVDVMRLALDSNLPTEYNTYVDIDLFELTR